MLAPSLFVFLSVGLRIDESPINASIVQGWNHTFLCKGIGYSIDWEINGIPLYKFPNGANINAVNYYSENGDNCSQESMMTVHAEISPEHGTLSIFTIQCIIRKDSLFAAIAEEAYLKVHGELVIV